MPNSTVPAAGEGLPTEIPVSERDFGESVRIAALLGAAAFKTSLGPGAHPDAELVYLGIDFDRRCLEAELLSDESRRLEDVRSKMRDELGEGPVGNEVHIRLGQASGAEAAISRFDIVHGMVCGIEEAIMSIPAKSPAGLLVKAKIVRYRCVSDPQLDRADGDQDYEVRCMNSLIKEIERLAMEA